MARVTIDMSKGIFDVEGSEEFVERQFKEFKPQLSSVNPKIPQPVEASASSSVKKGAKTSAQTRKPSKRKEIPAIFKDIDPIPTKLNSGLGYSKLKSAQDRLRWVLSLAKQLKIEGLIASDVTWLTDYLGAGILAKDVAINFQRIRNKDHANQSTQTGKMRLTDDGQEYLNELSRNNKDEK